MWNEKYCPICAKEMKVSTHSNTDDPFYILQCPTKFKIPISTQAPPMVYDGITSTHFEIEIRNGKTFYEHLKIWPYSIQSYDDETNIYQINSKLYTNFIVAIPYMEIPWDNLDKLISKIKTYTVFL